jgi:hypothetical protein
MSNFTTGVWVDMQRLAVVQVYLIIIYSYTNRFWIFKRHFKNRSPYEWIIAPFDAGFLPVAEWVDVAYINRLGQRFPI